MAIGSMLNLCWRNLGFRNLFPVYSARRWRVLHGGVSALLFIYIFVQH